MDDNSGWTVLRLKEIRVKHSRSESCLKIYQLTFAISFFYIFDFYICSVGSQEFRIFEFVILNSIVFEMTNSKIRIWWSGYAGLRSIYMCSSLGFSGYRDNFCKSVHSMNSSWRHKLMHMEYRALHYWTKLFKDSGKRLRVEALLHYTNYRIRKLFIFSPRNFVMI